ncbi:MAG: hypothetical protein KAR87_05560 [Candidatus Aenigmarchaeota archaeon]|nr:hypothetical protein [Candidatus Aenigmarchaeota archaeon]MCK5176706.1 hypothetical protein [Candidatus Aenigmarchaeota archaeon]
MNLVLKDKNKAFPDIFEDAIIAEYSKESQQNQKTQFSKHNNSISINITSPSPAKLRGMTSSINRLWDMGKKIYYEI